MRIALARAEGMLGAARAYTYDTMDRVWDALHATAACRASCASTCACRA